MIEVKNLVKEFGSVKAVSDVSFSVESGEILGFLGPNGAGKTTTMRILCGIFPPTSGRALVAGFDVGKKSIEVRRRIGYLPEQVPLYTELTVNEYLDFVASFWKCSKKKRDEVLQSCGLEQVAQAIIGRLSRGYRQRVGLAQALVHDPEVLILDEPTVGLDPKQIREIRELIKGFAGKKTIILSTHILPEASMACQKVVIIHQGKIVAQGTPESLTHQIVQGIAVELEVKGPVSEIQGTLSSTAGVSKVSVLPVNHENAPRFLLELESAEFRPRVAEAIVRKNWELLELRTREVSLEDIFLKLVTKEDIG